MGLLKSLKNLFSSEKKGHNARDFVEILRTLDVDLAKETKAKLEKYKIPVYEIDHQISVHSSSGKIILRIPKKYLNQANSILNK
jgi:hypothetical protein